MRIWKPKSFRAWIVIAVLICQISALSAATSGLFTYEVNGDAIKITGYPNNAAGDVEIPATINGKPVTSIGSYGFQPCARLTSVSIPASVTEIEDMDLPGGKSLKAITVDPLNANY